MRRTTAIVEEEVGKAGPEEVGKAEPEEVGKAGPAVEDDFKYGITEERYIPNGVTGACLRPLSVFDLSQSGHPGAFMFFFKNLLIQPPVRKYIVEKHNPDVFYRMVHLPSTVESGDPNTEEKIARIKYVIQNVFNCREPKPKPKPPRKTAFTTMECSKKFIFDFAEQIGHGGHYTALAYINDKIEYMDPDPFFYGNEGDNGVFSDFVSHFPNPISMYGTHNVDNTSDVKREKSIQNISYLDKFCQSWSLLFITLSGKGEFAGLPEEIQFQTTVLPHVTESLIAESLPEDIDEILRLTLENFSKFKNNLNILFRFWIALFSDESINDVLLRTKFKNWNTSNIVEKLGQLQGIINGYTQEQYIENIDCVDVDREGFFEVSPPRVTSARVTAAREKAAARKKAAAEPSQRKAKRRASEATESPIAKIAAKGGKSTRRKAVKGTKSRRKRYH